MAVDGPLTGFRVLDLATILAGPLCCQILGDYGADVVKIEHPRRGDAMRGHGEQKDGHPLWWKEISRNKRTVGLDISVAEGREVLLALAADADVLVESFRPGTLERWGLGPEVLLDVNPDLVIVRISGFGQAGPYAGRAGFGTLAEAMSGFAHLTGEADGPPTLPAFGLADSICGIAASSAAVMALLARQRGTARGQVVDLSLLEPILTAVGPGPTVYDQLGVEGRRHGNRSHNNAPRNTYETADGAWVAVSTSAQSIAERVMTLVGRPDVVAEPWFATGRGRVEHGDELDAAVAGWIAARPLDEVLAAFADTGAAVAPVYSASGILADPQVRALEMVTRVPDADLGPLAMHNVMWRMSETPGAIRFTGRDLGADTDAVLAELGYATDRVAALKEQGVVA